MVVSRHRLAQVLRRADSTAEVGAAVRTRNAETDTAVGGRESPGLDPEVASRIDPAMSALTGAPGFLSTERLQEFDAAAQPAAVLLPLVERRGDVQVLFVEKAQGLAHHAGQIGFPGGRIEATDASAIQAALREAQEEIALPAGIVDVIGLLPEQRTLTSRFKITPVVGWVGGEFTPVPDASEVVAAFEVPLAFFLDPANARCTRRRLFGVELDVVEFRHGERRIWGATAAILLSLTTRIRALGGDSAGDSR